MGYRAREADGAVKPSRQLDRAPSDAGAAHRLMEAGAGYLVAEGSRKGHLPSTASVRTDLPSGGAQGQLFDDVLVLQILTHKSLDHGRQPYNEKLAMLGGQLCRLCLASELMRSSPEMLADEGAMEAIEKGSSAWALGGLADVVLPGVRPLLRWKPRAEGNILRSGERKVAGNAVAALVGALDLRYGTVVARKFVEDKLVALLVTEMRQQQQEQKPAQAQASAV
ncbi:hypothetical protein PYCC9005_000835 [Savitreella phatthalungensis]